MKSSDELWSDLSSWCHDHFPSRSSTCSDLDKEWLLKHLIHYVDDEDISFVHSMLDAIIEAELGEGEIHFTIQEWITATC